MKNVNIQNCLMVAGNGRFGSGKARLYVKVVVLMESFFMVKPLLSAKNGGLTIVTIVAAFFQK